MYEENNAGARRVGFGHTIHGGVLGCVRFRLKNPRAGLVCVVIFRPIENSKSSIYPDIGLGWQRIVLY